MDAPEPYYSNRPLLNIFEFEASEEGGAGAAAGLTPEAAESGAPGEAADLSAVSAPAAAPVWETPEFQDAVAAQAAEIADARIAAMRAEQAQAAQAPVQGAAPPFPDQYSENYGQEMAAWMAWRDEQLLSKIDQRISPVTESLTATEQARVAAEGDQRVQDMIADDISRNGDLGETARSLIRPLAEARYGEYAQRYGEGRRAAEAAIQSAAATIRQSVAEERTAAATAETNRINLLGGLRDTPAEGASGISGIQTVETDTRKLVQKHAARIAAMNGATT